MRSIKNYSAIHLIIGGLSFILAALIVLFLGFLVESVASELAGLECAGRTRTGAGVAFDSQQLEIKFISYRYGPDELALTAGRAMRQEDFSIAGWRTGEPGSEVAPLVLPATGSRAGLTLSVCAISTSVTCGA